MQRHWAVIFPLSTLRNKWSTASKLERESEERESCFKTLSTLTVLLVHLGHLFFRCHLSCQWQMTPQQPGGSGRTHSPQAKLVQDLVHLLAPPSSPSLLPSNLYSLQRLAHSSLGSWSLDFTPHLAAAHFSLSLFFFFFFFKILLLWDAVWLRTL